MQEQEVLIDNETKHFTTQQFLELALSIPAEKYCAKAYEDKEGRYCFIGHMRIMHEPFDINKDSKESKWIRARSCHFLPSNLDITNIAFVNDFKSNLFPQETPKERVVALLNKMIENGFI